MMHWIEPVLPALNLHRDFGVSDRRREIEASMEREALLKGYFEGTVADDTIDDCLAEHGFDPFAFWNEACHNIENVIEVTPDEMLGLDRLIRNVNDGKG